MLTLLQGKWQMRTNMTDAEVRADCLYPVLERLNASFLERHFGPNFMGKQAWLGDFVRKVKSEASGAYPRESFMLGVYVATEHLYGLPERSGHYFLNSTRGSQPYRMYASDKFPHVEWDSRAGLYSGIPYVTGHRAEGEVSLAWVSGAETHVDVVEYAPPGKRKGRLVNFITEGGQIDFFMFGGSSPKANQLKLATLTGFAPLPPLFSLGFHYSKWEKTTARKVMTYNDQFEANGFPLDVLWLDIGHTNDG